MLDALFQAGGSFEDINFAMRKDRNLFHEVVMDDREQAVQVLLPKLDSTQINARSYKGRTALEQSENPLIREAIKERLKAPASPAGALTKFSVKRK